MHKGTILLCKAVNRESAVSEIREFMECYGESKVWDWYVIGGRWTGLLCQNKDKFDKKAKEILKPKDGMIQQSEIEAKQPKLQQIWEDLGETGQNPYCDHYKLPDTGQDSDITPLARCLAKVNDWHQDSIKEGKQAEKHAKGWLNGERGTNDYNMYGYCLKEAANHYQQEFSFDSNVFNIESYNYAIPENTDGWWAVIVDMHN